MSDQSKSFSNLITGIIRQDYYDDSSITDEILKSELYENVSESEFKALANKVRAIIRVI